MQLNKLCHSTVCKVKTVMTAEDSLSQSSTINCKPTYNLCKPPGKNGCISGNLLLSPLPPTAYKLNDSQLQTFRKCQLALVQQWSELSLHNKNALTIAQVHKSALNASRVIRGMIGAFNFHFIPLLSFLPWGCVRQICLNSSQESLTFLPIPGRSFFRSNCPWTSVWFYLKGN